MAGAWIPGADTAGDSEAVMPPFCQLNLPQRPRQPVPAVAADRPWSLFGHNLQEEPPGTFAGGAGCLVWQGDI
ncbi:hypothetical protein GCM10007175_32400 [Pseudarthrobacter scleromae]|uniref:Uncharacterized protein n=1 Tax=Pseudarthrobacter scleromae TaxID=158897 RepID=A0ABQ2CJJ0_9MICC|nr:hypothetical protein GCM10007175_32400 [Pseudarthrobacter scleromae]